MSEFTVSADRSQQWFAVQVWAGREDLSARHLSSRGYEVFLPCYRRVRQWSDRTRTVERALFTGYVFCQVVGETFGRIVTSPGVIRILGDGSRPIPIATEEIQALQRVSEHALAVEPWEYLHAGDRVRIERGPLQNVEGIVLRIHNGQRLILSIGLLNQSVAVEIDPMWVSIPSRSWREGGTPVEIATH